MLADTHEVGRLTGLSAIPTRDLLENALCLMEGKATASTTRLINWPVGCFAPSSFCTSNTSVLRKLRQFVPNIFQIYLQKLLDLRFKRAADAKSEQVCNHPARSSGTLSLLNLP